MWSRTVTLNTALSFAVRDRVAHGRQGPRGQSGHHLGQLVEVRLPGEERVEGGVAQQFEGERHAVGGRAARGAGRGDDADLARADAEATRVERPTKGEPNLGVAIPAEVDDGALDGEQVEGALKAR